VRRYNPFLLYLVDYATIGLIYFVLSGSFTGSLFLPLVCCLSLFSFRALDREHLTDFNQLLVRSFVAIALANLINYAILRLIYLSFFSGIGRVRLTTLAIHTFVCAPAVALLSYYLFRVLKNKIKPCSYAVIGREEELKELLEEIEQKSDEYRFVQFIESKDQVKKLRDGIAGIVVSDYSLYETLQPELRRLNCNNVIFLPHIAETVLKRIPLKLVEKFKAYYETSFNAIVENAYKRILDVILATLALVITSPIVLIIAILIFLEDGRPIFYRQRRVGKDGKEFEFVKLRSLKQKGFDPQNPNKNIEQRVLKIGKFVRKYRLDELPQFWLVLKGDMSVVGPRPEMVEYHLQYVNRIPYYHYRLKLKPGLTGWAQINYQHTTTLEEYRTKLEYDLYYVKNHSILLDLSVILKTFEAVVFRRGAR
jgi:exopolysaccharide biosynthesis polyprenyl glycosylphosphotransferase